MCIQLKQNLVNLPAVSIKSELLIHSIIKKIEACIMKQFTSYPLTTNTEVNFLFILFYFFQKYITCVFNIQ